MRRARWQSRRWFVATDGGAVDAPGNPAGAPVTIPVDLAGLAAPTGNDHLRATISDPS